MFIHFTRHTNSIAKSPIENRSRAGKETAEVRMALGVTAWFPPIARRIM